VCAHLANKDELEESEVLDPLRRTNDVEVVVCASDVEVADAHQKNFAL